jgi:NAD(P)-dependent dehydrogenase (short-subunit alcohol dehydrogenase family)
MTDIGEPDPVIREVADVTGKVAIVTGGASGIGRAAAVRLALGGASILVADRDEVGGHGTVELIADAGGVAHFCTVDVTDPNAIIAMVDDAVATYGRLDLAVNNAGMSGTYAALGDQTLEDWNRTLAVNLTSVFLSMQAEIAAMIDTGGGSIVNTASGAGLMGFANLPAYVASKHGVVGLTKSVALEFARKGIRVNAVCPGSVRTPMLEGFTGGDEAALQGMGKMQPIGRLGTPDEIAEAIAWLCSDAASFVTGVALPVDGGVMAT